MSHPEPRMAALLDVVLRTAEAKDQEITQALFRTGEIILRI